MSESILTYRGMVYPWQCDHMGHMNVMWYAGKFDEASWQAMARLGVTRTYMLERNCMMAAVQQDTAYKRELRTGDILTVRTRIHDIGEKTVRMFHEMKNDGTGEIAATSAVTGIHIDKATRRPCPFPHDLLRVMHNRVTDEIREDVDITQHITAEASMEGTLSGDWPTSAGFASAGWSPQGPGAV
jgi:acyl-CoA thioester hydrolase